jgi:hypothetical protein
MVTNKHYVRNKHYIVNYKNQSPSSCRRGALGKLEILRERVDLVEF